VLSKKALDPVFGPRASGGKRIYLFLSYAPKFVVQYPKLDEQEKCHKNYYFF
jgi:hypothetical protein